MRRTVPLLLLALGLAGHPALAADQRGAVPMPQVDYCGDLKNGTCPAYNHEAYCGAFVGVSFDDGSYLVGYCAPRMSP